MKIVKTDKGVKTGKRPVEPPFNLFNGFAGFNVFS
jgi:hypothetical protein